MSASSPSSGQASGSWPAERVPQETVAAVRRELGPLVDGVLEAVRRENPVYAQVLEAGEGVAIRLGIEQAVGAFLTGVERGQHPGREAAEVWRRLGEAEFQAGRSLDALRSAFRTGIRAAWRGAAELAVRAGVSPELVVSLAEAIFVYADELAADVVEGYVRVQSDEAGERERRRRRLATLLVEPEPDAEVIAHAAELAHWPLPRALAAVVIRPREAISSPHPDALPGGEDWFLVPDPDAPRRMAELRRGIGGAAAGLGPSVAPQGARHSLRLARLAVRLAAEGELVEAGERLTDMLLLADDALCSLLVQERLAPLLALGEGERERLLETLRAWLDHQRHVPRVAEELHVHPQTVRYRLARLRELLGGALESPERRLELRLSLRAHALAGTLSLAGTLL